MATRDDIPRRRRFVPPELKHYGCVDEIVVQSDKRQQFTARGRVFEGTAQDFFGGS